MNVSVVIRLGRISNLPTVWTNVLAALALVGSTGTMAGPAITASVMVALSLLYIGGMYLNDAFDRDIDSRERPERPIPSGEIGAPTVFAVGFALMGMAVALLAATGYVIPGGTGWYAASAAAGLAVVIVFYDMYHKGNPLSPVVMGFCRALVYVTAAFAVVTVPPADVLIAAGVLWSYVIGLSYIAKQETLGRVTNLWPAAFLAAPLIYCLPTAASGAFGLAVYVAFAVWIAGSIALLACRRGADVPRAVVGLIAGMCLLDALLILGAGGGALAWVAVALFPLTVLAQRAVPGT